MSMNRKPTIHLWLYGDGLNEALSSAQLEIVENEQPQSIIGDTVEESLDPVDCRNRPLADQRVGQQRAEQPKQNCRHSAHFGRKASRRAGVGAPSGSGRRAHALAHRRIPDHSSVDKRPNLLYNSVVLSQSESTTTNDQLTSLLLQSMATFTANDTQSVKQSAKSILLFANGNSQVDVEQVATQALAQGIHIHVINLSSAPAESPELQQLAELTQGNFVDESGLDTIWQSLINYHTQRHIAYLPKHSNQRDRRLVAGRWATQTEPALRNNAPESSTDTAPAPAARMRPKSAKRATGQHPRQTKQPLYPVNRRQLLQRLSSFRS